MRSTLLSRIVIYRSIRNASASRFLLPSILLDHVSQLDYKFPFFIFLTWFKSVFIFPACISVIHTFDLFGKKKVQKRYLPIIYSSVTFWFYNMVPITKSGPFMSINDFRPTALHCTTAHWWSMEMSIFHLWWSVKICFRENILGINNLCSQCTGKLYSLFIERVWYYLTSLFTRISSTTASIAGESR